MSSSDKAKSRYKSLSLVLKASIRGSLLVLALVAGAAVGVVVQGLGGDLIYMLWPNLDTPPHSVWSVAFWTEDVAGHLLFYTLPSVCAAAVTGLMAAGLRFGVPYVCAAALIASISGTLIGFARLNEGRIRFVPWPDALTAYGIPGVSAILVAALLCICMEQRTIREDKRQ
jgi:uncharacterized membrane protein